MSYLAGMGVTAVWISPPVDNPNANVPDGNVNNVLEVKPEKQ